MDFYDSIFQYDLEIENKITKRLNKFLKFINILKNENPLNLSNTGEMKYNHITDILEEIKTSNKFKNRLFINKKKNLLLRMNNKTKVNSKYYIYAKNMSQNDHKIDIIKVKNNILKKDSSIDSNDSKTEKGKKILKIFNQKKLRYYFNNNNKNNDYNTNEESSEENEELNILKSDSNKIICDMIKQNVKNKYKKILNEIILKNKNKNIDEINLDINKLTKDKKEIKNNNYLNNDLTKKGTDTIKNNGSEKNSHTKYIIDSKKQTDKNELRNSVTSSNGNNLKIKVYNDMLLNFHNLNNDNTLNKLLIVNKKVKSAKNDNYNRNRNIKNKIREIKEEKKDIMDYTHKKKIPSNNNLNNTKNSELDEENHFKILDKTHKKLAVRNMQRIHIKNVKLKSNQTGYNLTNFRKKQISDLDDLNLNNDENSNKNLTKKNKQKNIHFASPCDIIIDGKKLNMLKFKLGKNYVSPNRKITEKSFKRNKYLENSVDKENSIISALDNKTRDNFASGMKFNSVRKKKLSDEKSYNELSQILRAKKVNENNFPIRNYRTNFNINNINIKNINNVNNVNNINRENNGVNNINIIRKESEGDNYIINMNNQIQKSLSKEGETNNKMPWHFSNSNANTIMNKSNNKRNMGKSYLHRILQADINNVINNNLDKKIKINKNNNIYKDINLKNNKDINYHYIYEQKQEKSIKNNKLRNNLNNFKKNEGYHDTIDNKADPSSYRGVKVKGKKRILSTRVHIRGIKSSKNFNNIF